MTGLVECPQQFTLEDLASLPQTELVTDIHCVTRWSKFDARFSGVSLATLLQECKVQSSARFVSFVARSERNHSSSLRIDEALELGCLLATHYEGQPLPEDHGGPLRGVVPKKYFYKSVKWIEKIELLQYDRPGYWEADSGYHNNADPWLEQRYIASSISKRDANALIENRDFSAQDLLSIDVTALDLTGLNARQAILRNANFRECRLIEADFSESNLSNACFRKADLNLANFQDADLEGADFSSADLRGANLTGCSLFGTTFCDATEDSIDNAALIDATTTIDTGSLERLTRVQREFLERALTS